MEFINKTLLRAVRVLVMRKKGQERHLLGGGQEAKGEGDKAPRGGSFSVSGGTDWEGPE